MDNLIIIGLSTTSDHVYNFIQEYKLFNIIGFAVDKEYIKNKEYKNLPIYSIDQLDSIIDKKKDYLFVAMLWNGLNRDRKQMYLRLKNQGYKFANLISPYSKMRGSLLGDNCWFHDYSIVQYGAQIESNVIAMASSLIGAESYVGAHCFLGAKSTVAGGCVIGEQTFIGINSTVFDDRKVGKKCIIGACTAVKRDMPDFSIIKSSSDIVCKQYLEDEIEDKLLFSKNKH